MLEESRKEDAMSKLVSAPLTQLSLDAGSKQRLRHYQTRVSSDSYSVIFDDRVVEIARRYAKSNCDIDGIIEYLNRLKDKDGLPFCQSIKQWSKAEEALARFIDANHTPFCWNENYQTAKREMIEMFSQLNLKPIKFNTANDIEEILPKKGTHAGFHYILTGMRKKGDYISDELVKTFEEWRCKRISRQLDSYPILLGFRTQASGAFLDDGSKSFTCKHKTRVVSMVDFYQILLESKYTVPFQRALSTYPCYAGGKDIPEIGQYISNFRSRTHYFTSIDYSSFDQTISNWLIRDAFDILKSAFKNVDDDEFSVIVNDFINKDFITDTGILHSNKGVPSGSMFTQIIDSLVNLLVIKTYFHSIHTPLQHCIVMGDDNLFFSNTPISVDKLSTYVKKNFGLIINPDKCNYGMCNSKDPQFLSRKWSAYGSYRDIGTIISKMAFPERFREYGGLITPEIVFYSYIMAYKRTMDEYFDTERFRLDSLELMAKKEEIPLDALPGMLRYLKIYTEIR